MNRKKTVKVKLEVLEDMLKRLNRIDERLDRLRGGGSSG